MCGSNGISLGARRRRCQCHAAGGSRCCQPNQNDYKGRLGCTNAQEKLPAICTAAEAGRQPFGAAEDLGTQKASKYERAIGAAGGCTEEVLHSCKQLPGSELFVSSGHGMGHCETVRECTG